jgi:hypothetical protein
MLTAHTHKCTQWCLNICEYNAHISTLWSIWQLCILWFSFSYYAFKSPLTRIWIIGDAELKIYWMMSRHFVDRMINFHLIFFVYQWLSTLWIACLNINLCVCAANWELAYSNCLTITFKGRWIFHDQIMTELWLRFHQTAHHRQIV